MEPAKYIMDSRVKMKACTALVKTARNIMGKGAKPDEVIVNAKKFRQHRPHKLSPFRNFNAC